MNYGLIYERFKNFKCDCGVGAGFMRLYLDDEYEVKEMLCTACQRVYVNVGDNTFAEKELVDGEDKET